MNKILTKTGALLVMFFILVLALIYMNLTGVEVSEVLIFLAGAMVKTFLDTEGIVEPEEKLEVKEILEEIGSESGIGEGNNKG